MSAATFREDGTCFAPPQHNFSVESSEGGKRQVVDLQFRVLVIVTDNFPILL